MQRVPPGLLYCSQNSYTLPAMKNRSDAGRLVPYLRVSTHGQAASGLGMDAQRRAIEDAAAAQGFEVVGWHEDAGRSGARADNRPGLQAALAEVAAGRADGL